MRSVSNDIINFGPGFLRLRNLGLRFFVPCQELEQETEILPREEASVARVAALAVVFAAFRPARRPRFDLDDKVGDLWQSSLWYDTPRVYFRGGVFNLIFRLVLEEKMCESLRVGFRVRRPDIVSRFRRHAINRNCARWLHIVPKLAFVVTIAAVVTLQSLKSATFRSVEVEAPPHVRFAAVML